jgi:hypothetical protein
MQRYYQGRGSGFVVQVVGWVKVYVDSVVLAVLIEPLSCP